MQSLAVPVPLLHDLGKVKELPLPLVTSLVSEDYSYPRMVMITKVNSNSGGQHLQSIYFTPHIIVWVIKLDTLVKL